jgi:hypothetical protein
MLAAFGPLALNISSFSCGRVEHEKKENRITLMRSDTTSLTRKETVLSCTSGVISAENCAAQNSARRANQRKASFA